jgi:hypothetical protein
MTPMAAVGSGGGHRLRPLCLAQRHFRGCLSCSGRGLGRWLAIHVGYGPILTSDRWVLATRDATALPAAGIRRLRSRPLHAEGSRLIIRRRAAVCFAKKEHTANKILPHSWLCITPGGAGEPVVIF